MNFGEWYYLLNGDSVMKVTNGWMYVNVAENDKEIDLIVYIPDDKHEMEHHWKIKE